MGAIVLRSLLWLALAAMPAALPAADVEPLVRAVEVRLDAPLGRPFDLERALAVRPGEPLAEEAVRRTLSNLHASGLVAGAAVLARPVAPAPEPGGADQNREVVAVVAIRAATWVDAVRLEGSLGLDRRDLERAIEQRAGTPLVPSRMRRSEEALRTLLGRAGYRQAQVAGRVEPTGGGGDGGGDGGGERAGVAAVFAIEAGPRALIGEVAFAGELERETEEALRRTLRAAPGKPYGRKGLERDVEALRAELVARGHLAARVELPAERYDAQEDRIDLTYPIYAGPRYRLEVVGAETRALRRRGLLPFLEDGGYDRALLRQSCARIRTALERRGHYRARVECVEGSPAAGGEARDEGNGDDEAGVAPVRIEVEPGPVYALEAIRFSGNETFDGERLRALMVTSERRPLRRGSGRLVQDDLDADLANIRSFYVLQGFPRARVGPAAVVVLEAGGEEGRLELTVPIVEGRRQRVVEVSFEGVEALAPAQLLEGLPLRPGGGPFHQVLLDESVNLLRARYENAGFPEVAIVPTLDWNEERTLVDVRFTVYEGHRAVVDRVVLRGQRRTRDAFLRRAVGLETGTPISRQRLLRAERDLYRLGIFSRAEVGLAPALEPGGRRDVAVRVEEGRPWRLGYGLSWHSEDRLGGLFSVTRANVDGRAGQLQLDLRANRNSQRYRLLYDRPEVGRRPGLTYILFFEDENRDAFAVNDRGLQVALRQRRGEDPRAIQLGLVYDYRLVDLSEVTDPSQIERQDTEVQISSVTPNLFVDRRDDPFAPGRGWTTFLQLEYAFPLLEARADFLKLFWQQTQHLPLGRYGVLAGSLRLGAIEPFDSVARFAVAVPDTLASARVPISERFFAGGRTSHRAYQRDELGIVGQTLIEAEVEGEDTPRRLAVGGNALALINLDYRFPIAGAFGGTVFLDAGNVWADWRDVDLGQVELGLGLGARYHSPIGPLRLEVGWKLDPLPGDSNPVVLLSFGNPF